MNIPEDLRYTKNDEWLRLDGETATIGITDYAQDQLSDVVYVEVTLAEGDTGARGEALGAVESVKAASDVYLPVSGEVTAVNDLLEATPELINTDPYGRAWMVKIRLSDPSEVGDLLDAAAYEAYLQERDH